MDAPKENGDGAGAADMAVDALQATAAQDDARVDPDLGEGAVLAPPPPKPKVSRSGRLVRGRGSLVRAPFPSACSVAVPHLTVLLGATRQRYRTPSPEGRSYDRGYGGGGRRDDRDRGWNRRDDYRRDDYRDGYQGGYRGGGDRR